MRAVVACTALIMAFVAETSGATAQIDPSNTPLQMYKDCFNQAIQGNRVAKVGQSIRFSCFGSIAKTFYDTLGQYGFPTRHYEGNGKKWSLRQPVTAAPGSGNSPGSCFFTYENQGQSVQQFACNLFFYAGDFINR